MTEHKKDSTSTAKSSDALFPRLHRVKISNPRDSTTGVQITAIPDRSALSFDGMKKAWDDEVKKRG